MQRRFAAGGLWKTIHLGVILVASLGTNHLRAQDIQRQRRAKPSLRAPRGLGDVNAALGLRASTVARLDLVATPEGGVATIIPVNGIPCPLELRPHSVRAPSFQVRKQLADGTFVVIPAGNCRTLRGIVTDMPGSMVAGVMSDRGLSARIVLPDGASLWVEPLASRVAGAGKGDHVIYWHNDVIPSGGTCLAMTAQGAQEGFMADATGSTSVESAGVGLAIVNLAIDADSDFVGTFANDQAAIADIEGIINTVNLVYERDLSISHVVTEIILRSPGSDPYTAIGALDLLCQFQGEWNTEPELSIVRDAAHLFTGKSLFDPENGGSIIGIAFINSMCQVNQFSPCTSRADIAYALSESKFSTNLDERVALTAHELGHNWGFGDHCNSDTGGVGCFIMCSSINGCDGISGGNLKFGQRAFNNIVLFRDTASCPQAEGLLSVTVGAPATTLTEVSTLQFTASAEFVVAGVQDVTLTTTWSVEPPSAGTVSATGLFTPANADGDTCAEVVGSFTFNSLTRTDRKLILISDLDITRAITDSFPPLDAIDARQPSPPSGTPPQGWDTFDLTFNGDVCMVVDAGIKVSETGGVIVPGHLVELVGARTIRVMLPGPIRPGVWTSLTEISSAATARFAALPVDVDGNGIVEAADIDAMQASLLGVGSPLPVWSMDIDRSGTATPVDILRAIDLWTSAENYERWEDEALPP